MSSISLDARRICGPRANRPWARPAVPLAGELVRRGSDVVSHRIVQWLTVALLLVSVLT
jgi:hypothetical protein